MNRRVLSAIGVVVAFGLSTAGVTSVSAAGDRREVDVAKSVYVCEQDADCSAKPKQISFSANNDLIGSRLKWTGWGAASSTGRGLIRVNWSGNPKVETGRVVLSGLQACGGAMVYRNGRVIWPGESVKVKFDCQADYGPTSLVSFRSPTGKLGCYMSYDAGSGTGVRCDASNPAYTTPFVPDCVDLEQGDSLWLADKVTSVCHGDTALGSDSVLKYGKSKRFGDQQCSMATTGVSCRNIRTGHGFRMSTGSYEIW